MKAQQPANEKMEITLSSDKIQNYIKWCLLELATNTKIDHRNNDDTNDSKVSNLKKLIQEHGGNFDKGISALADLISSNKKLIKLVNKLGKLNSSADKDYDVIYEAEIDIIHIMIELSGLFEINALHADDKDCFTKKFVCDVCEIKCFADEDEEDDDDEEDEDEEIEEEIEDEDEEDEEEVEEEEVEEEVKEDITMKSPIVIKEDKKDEKEVPKNLVRVNNNELQINEKYYIIKRNGDVALMPTFVGYKNNKTYGEFSRYLSTSIQKLDCLTLYRKID